MTFMENKMYDWYGPWTTSMHDFFQVDICHFVAEEDMMVDQQYEQYQTDQKQLLLQQLLIEQMEKQLEQQQLQQQQLLIEQMEKLLQQYTEQQIEQESDQ